MLVYESAADEYLKISMSKCYVKVRLAIYMMALGALGCTGTSHTFQEVEEHQEPSALLIMHSASVNSLKVHSQVVGQEW